MAIALITLLLLETVLQLFWNSLYFPFGIPVFNARIPASAELRSRLALNSLERDVHSDTWLPLVFKPLPDGSMAFRETFFISTARRYYPVMRGLVIIDEDRRQIRVVGLCNWNVLAISLSLFPVIAIMPKAAPMLFALPLFGYSYWVQRGRFQGVADAIREQLANERSVESLLARHAAMKRLY